MAPLSSFSARIKLAFSLNLIPDTVYNDLERVRDVRNAFAHQIADLTFASDPIKAICLALEFPLDYLGPEDIYHLRNDPRQWFIFTCSIVSTLLEPRGHFYKCAQEMKEKIKLNAFIGTSSESSG
jgi:hypothetical protein